MRHLLLSLTFITTACQSTFRQHGFDIPIVDLDQRSDLQILVDKEKGQ